MRRFITCLCGVLAILLWLAPVASFALDQPNFGGNNSSDYQPPTGNPQGTVPGSLQTTNSALQPVPTLNQQALVQSGGLSVLTAPDKGATSTARDVTTNGDSKAALITWIIGGILTFLAVAYVLFKSDKVPVSVGAGINAAVPTDKNPEASEKPKKQSKKSTKKTKSKKKKPTRK